MPSLIWRKKRISGEHVIVVNLPRRPVEHELLYHRTDDVSSMPTMKLRKTPPRARARHASWRVTSARFMRTRSPKRMYVHVQIMRFRLLTHTSKCRTACRTASSNSIKFPPRLEANIFAARSLNLSDDWQMSNYM